MIRIVPTFIYEVDGKVIKRSTAKQTKESLEKMVTSTGWWF